MAKTESQLYGYHTENLRAINSGYTIMSRALKLAIRLDDKAHARAGTILLAVALGAWIEARLHKLLYEPKSFTPAERRQVLGQKTMLSRWQELLTVSLSKATGVKKKSISGATVGPTVHFQYEAIKKSLDEHVEPLLAVRNRLAHGQWVYPLTSDLDDVSSDLCLAIRSLDILRLSKQKRMVTAIAQLVHDMSISPPTFKRDFDRHYGTVLHIQHQLSNHDYEAYENELKAKHAAGQLKKAAAPASSE